MPQLKALILTAIGVALGCAVVLLLLEFSVRGLNYARILPPTTLWEFRARQPEPYKDAPYFSAAFIAESKIQPGGWSTPSGTTLVLPNNFEGRWFNVRDHKRVTVGQPEIFQHTVHLFGGSTIYNAEVPDDQTVASQLQAQLNAYAADTWRVVNYGASTITASQQLELLKQTDVKPGDVVIFYDGVNDAVQGVFYNNPQGWMVQSNRERLKKLGWFAYVVRGQLWLRDHSALGALILPAPDSGVPEHLANPSQRDAVVAETALRYKNALIAAAKFSQEHGARFVHMLQPHVFMKPEPTPYEQALKDNTLLIQPGLDVALGLAYPVFKTALENFKMGVNSVMVDGSSVLDSVPDVHLDFCHITHKGNKAIAEALFPFVIRSDGVK